LEPLDVALDGRVGDLLIRLGFANQAAYKNYEDGAHSTFNLDAMLAADAAAVELGDGASSIDVQQLPAYLDEISASLDQRDAVMSGKSTVSS